MFSVRPFRTGVCALLAILMLSCNKDATNPLDTGDGPTSGDYGSGTLTFNTNKVGNFASTGTWSGSAGQGVGSGIWAYIEPQSQVVWIYGLKWRSQSDWDVALLELTNSGAAPTTGSYSFQGSGAKNATLSFATNVSSFTDYTQGYMLTGGLCNITSLSSTGLRGNFSGTGVHTTDSGKSIAVTNGVVEVTFGTAR